MTREDHIKLAEDALTKAKHNENYGGSIARAQYYATVAQAHATLALAIEEEVVPFGSG